MSVKKKNKGKIKKITFKLTVIQWVAIIALLVVLALISWLGYMGVFSKVKVVEQKVGPFVLVYENMRGDYAKTGMVMTKIYDSLKKDKVITVRGMGIYYDNPQKVRKEDLRSTIGCLLEPKDYRLIPRLSYKYKIKQMDTRRAMVITFPYRNRGSIYIGIMKAYPELMRYAQKHNYRFTASIELYDMSKMQTLYMMDIIRK